MKQRQSSDSLDAAINSFESDFEIAYHETASIKKSIEDVIKRHEAISEKHENNDKPDTKPPNIITLNVSGTEMFARRDTLTAVKGSRLEALFSGRWEKGLLRDEENRVFVDAEPVVFGKIIKYLKMVKISAKQGRQESGSVKHLCYPTVSGSHEKHMFDTYLDIFHLHQEAGAGASAAKDANKNKKEYLYTKSERAMIAKMESDLEEMLEQEEYSVPCFVINDNEQEQQPQQRKGAYKDTKRNAISDETRGILNLYIDGHIMVVKKSTLCLDPQSKLAQEFSNDEWLDEHKVINENGKTLFVVDHSVGAFQAMVHHLQVKSMTEDVDGTSLVSIEIEDEFEREYFERMVTMYFAANFSMDSRIVEDVASEKIMKDWLESVERTCAPKLLYRASRDGWKIQDFHGNCDDKGATLVVVKSEEGYVFGGYSDVSWSSSSGGYNSSTDAFLFSLKCHAGLDPMKMNVKKGRESSALLHNASYGPTFGGGNDLYIGSSANTVHNATYTHVGVTYELPEGTDDEHFLTGSKNFKLLEYEVFEV